METDNVYKPNAETLALLERIERGDAEMAGPFKTFAGYKDWMSNGDPVE